MTDGVTTEFIASFHWFISIFKNRLFPFYSLFHSFILSLSFIFFLLSLYYSFFISFFLFSFHSFSIKTKFDVSFFDSSHLNFLLLLGILSTLRVEPSVFWFVIQISLDSKMMNRCKTFTVLDSPLKENQNSVSNRVAQRRPGQSLFSISPPKKQEEVVEKTEATPVMELKQFQSKEMLDFKEALVNGEKTLSLVLRNPSSAPQDVLFKKHPNSEKGFSVKGDPFFHVAAKTEVRVEFLWEPKKEGKVFDTCTLETSDGHMLQVNLIGSCVPPKKPNKFGPNRKRAVRRVGFNDAEKKPVQPVKPVGPSEKELRSVGVIERAWLRYASRKKLKRMKSAVLVIERSWMRYHARKLRQLELERRRRSVLVIERTWMKHKKRKAVSNSAAMVIQTAWRKYKEREAIRSEEQRSAVEAFRQRRAVRIIENAWIQFLDFKRIHHLNLKRNAVSVIERTWIRYSALKALKLELEKRSKAANTIANAWIRYSARKALKLELERRKQAVGIIQNAWIRFQCRKAFKLQRAKEQNAVLVIERAWVVYRARVARKLEWERRTNAIQVIERAWCVHRARVVRRLEMERRKNAIATIESAWIVVLQRRRFRRELDQAKQAVRVIEDAWLILMAKRTLSELKQEAAMKLERQRNAVQVIWNAWIRYSARKALKLELERRKKLELERRKQAVGIIENAWIRFQCRKAFKLQQQREKNAVLVIERAWVVYRARVARKLEWERRTNAIQVIERAWCVHRARVVRRLEMERRRNAIAAIESAWIVFLQRRKFKQELDQAKLAVRIIEDAWIILKAKRALMDLRQEAAMKLEQQRQEAAMKLEQQRQEAAMKLEQQRQEAAMKLERQRQAVRVIENNWIIHSENKRLKSTIQFMERAWSQYQALKAAQFEHERKAVLLIERTWRKYHARQLELERQLSLERNAVQVIERAWISCKERKALLMAASSLALQAALAKQQSDPSVPDSQSRTSDTVKAGSPVTVNNNTFSYSPGVDLSDNGIELEASGTISIDEIIRQNFRNYDNRKASTSRRISEPLKALTEEQLLTVTSSVLDVLLSYESLHSLLSHLDSLEVTTRVSKDSCVQVGKKNNATPILCNVLRECNQSLPHKKLCLAALDILLNLAKVEETIPTGPLATLVIDTVSEKAKASLKDDQILSKCLSLIWILVKNGASISVSHTSSTFDNDYKYLILRLLQRNDCLKGIRFWSVSSKRQGRRR